ncbi:MAG: tetratricopeptide repeat protein [Nocardioides sp.]
MTTVETHAVPARTVPGPSSVPTTGSRRVLDLRCHRRLRGPYTGGGQLLRLIVPELAELDPELVRPMATAVVAIAPDLEGKAPPRPQTLTDQALGIERTRFYPVERTRDLAYLVSELLRIWVESCHPDGVLLRWWELAEADSTDTELVAMIRRRLDPAVVEIADLGHYRAPIPAESAELLALGRAPIDPAQRYIDADCTSADPLLRSAYDALDPAQRARRHGARAALLIERAEPGSQLGAIPYHLERSETPEDAIAWLVDGQNQAFSEGFYEAALDLGGRGRALVSWSSDSKTHNYLTKRVIGSLTYLSRCDEAMAVIGEHRLVTTEISEQMNDAYMMAMIYTRHLDRDRIDQDAALAWVNTALAIAEGEPDPSQRAFYRAFMRNARALVEMHRGNVDGSLALVEESIAIADEHLGEKHALHRTVLLTNRARVLLALGDHAGALAAFDEVLERDPEYDDPHFERSVAHKTMGNIEAALGDLDRAIELSIAFTDAYYNRADIRMDLGQDELAMADLTTLLDIDPDHVDARLNRASLLMAGGDLDGAYTDLEEGLRRAPDSAELWSALGLVSAEQERTDDALSYFQSALERDPGLVDALGNRAVLYYATGRTAESVADLDRALEFADTAELRTNRGIGRHELGDFAGAIEDFSTALDDDALADNWAGSLELMFRRGLSRHAAGDLAGAEADWTAHLALAEESGVGSDRAEDIHELLVGWSTPVGRSR